MQIFSTKIYVLLVPVCLYTLACGSKKEDKPKTNAPQSINVDGYIVKAESFSESIEVPGSIIASDATEIFPEVSGRITSLNIAEGRMVNKGQLLAKIYDGDLQAQLQKLKIQEGIAKNNEDRASQLLAIQGISKQDYDATLLNWNNIQADINIIKTQITRTEIRAPFTGKLGLRNVSIGAYVSPVSAIAVINRTQELKIDFNVPEKYISRIHEGQVINFTIEGNDQQYAAKVAATESNVTAENRSLKVRATVTGAISGLTPGGFAKVQLSFTPKSNALFVPSQGLVPTARGKQIITYNGGKALFTDVTTGVRDSSRVEVLSGLKTGDTVIISNIMSLKPNTPISIKKIVN